MTIKRWNGTAYVDLTTLKRWNGTSWVDITLAKRWDGTAWTDIPLPGGGTPPLSVTVSPGYAYGELNITNPPFPTAQAVNSNAVTMTANGGTGTPVYSWEFISGDQNVQPVSPLSATTYFKATLLRNRDTQAVWRARVIRGAENVSAFITVRLAYYSGDV